MTGRMGHRIGSHNPPLQPSVRCKLAFPRTALLSQTKCGRKIFRGRWGCNCFQLRYQSTSPHEYRVAISFQLRYQSTSQDEYRDAISFQLRYQSTSPDEYRGAISFQLRYQSTSPDEYRGTIIFQLRYQSTSPDEYRGTIIFQLRYQSTSPDEYRGAIRDFNSSYMCYSTWTVLCYSTGTINPTRLWHHFTHTSFISCIT